MEPKFKVDDLVTDGKFSMKVVAVIKVGVLTDNEENEEYWYECKPIDFEAPFNREISQDKLQAL